MGREKGRARVTWRAAAVLSCEMGPMMTLRLRAKPVLLSGPTQRARSCDCNGSTTAGGGSLSSAALAMAVFCFEDVH